MGNEKGAFAPFLMGFLKRVVFFFEFGYNKDIKHNLGGKNQ